ncbi:hypothetical protein [Pseudomonas sp. GD03944]|nr:hypothetical protein [Pseudomonas sp. GD03944]MDH1265383.1 hypothetical protein [Pseudomonas sp. GD03944]
MTKFLFVMALFSAYLLPAASASSIETGLGSGASSPGFALPDSSPRDVQ